MLLRETYSPSGEANSEGNANPKIDFGPFRLEIRPTRVKCFADRTQLGCRGTKNVGKFQYHLGGPGFHTPV